MRCAATGIGEDKAFRRLLRYNLVKKNGRPTLGEPRHNEVF